MLIGGDDISNDVITLDPAATATRGACSQAMLP